MDLATGGGLVLAMLIIVFYFLPALIASQRDTSHQGAIFFINLAFGWTILGWLAALIWAVAEHPKVKVTENPWAAPIPTYTPLYPERTNGAPQQDKPWAEPFSKQ